MTWVHFCVCCLFRHCCLNRVSVCAGWLLCLSVSVTGVEIDYEEQRLYLIFSCPTHPRATVHGSFASAQVYTYMRSSSLHVQ